MTLPTLKAYISETFCDSNDLLIDAKTPLLELNILDSLSMYDLIDFINRSFEIEIPLSSISVRNFTTLEDIAQMVDLLKQSRHPITENKVDK